MRRDEDKAQRSDQHQRHAEQNGDRERFFAAVDVPCGIVVADDWDDTGLHRAERDEKERLPLIVKPKRRDRLVAEAGQYQVETEYIKGIRRLHQDIRYAKTENRRNMAWVHLCRGRAAEALFHHDERRHDLPRDGRRGSAGNRRCFAYSRPTRL